jgi:hypothetical protein
MMATVRAEIWTRMLTRAAVMCRFQIQKVLIIVSQPDSLRDSYPCWPRAKDSLPCPKRTSEPQGSWARNRPPSWQRDVPSDW